MAFQLPRLKKCCCCIPLRIGSLFIGYFAIVASVFTLVASSWSIYKVTVYVETNKNNVTGHPADDVTKTAMGLYISLVYSQIVFLYNLVLGIILVVGVHRNKPNFLTFYCNATLFLFVLGLVLVVITCVFMGFLATIPVLKWCFTLLFCLIIVKSTYFEMIDNEKPPIEEMTELRAYEAQAPTVA